MVTDCPDHCPMPTPPDGWTRQAQRQHPTFHHYVDQPGVPCELEAGHPGPHRNGGLVWHNPPVLYVGGKLVEGEA